MSNLSNEDMALCVAFVDGALEREAQLEFQRRMAAEPELAAAAQALLETDEMLRKLNAGTQRKLARIHRMRPWVWAASIAAAAALLFMFGRALLTPTKAPSFEVAVAPSFESPLDYIASKPELAGLRPPGLDLTRGENSTPNVDASEFVARATGVEARASKPVADADDIRAGFFVLPVSLARESTLVVVAFSKKSAGARTFRDAQRLWPEASDARPVAQLGRLEAGEHVLPQPRFTVEPKSDGTASISYHRGFLVPIGCEELLVACAAREAPLSDADLAAIDAATAQGFAQLSEALAGLGFKLRAFAVHEPGD